MDIFVCVKQVPATSKMTVDEKTGVLKRDGVESKMNPYDLFALETALIFREQYGAKVTVGTMGPPQAQEIILEAYMMGADEGYLFSDKRLGGADVLATSYALSQGIKAIGDFDLILCGKQTTDGDTAQVGPSIAEHMHIPHVAWGSRIEKQGEGVQVEQQLQDTVETVWMPFPCLVTVEKDICVPRLPSLMLYKSVRHKPVTVLGLERFMDQQPEHYGLMGSPTQVERIFPPDVNTQQNVIRGEQCGQQLYELLITEKLI